ncbi:S46 family peptidase, partial [Saprospiraceae bacterium]|nr:S46 family peptidase [Saprospiraceae bacterium]
GVEEGDFTLIFGFPGRTNQYLPSPAVRQIKDVLDPAKIEIRDVALKIMDKYMREDEQTRIQYASKFARIANYWKKWQGEKTGLEKSNAVGKKQDLEDEFMKIVKADNKLFGQYGHLMTKFGEKYAAIEKYAYTRDYYNEVVGRNVEILRVAGVMGRLATALEKNGETGYNDFKGRVEGFLADHFKNYNAQIDKEVLIALSDLYRNNVDKAYTPTAFVVKSKTLGPIMGDMFDRSIFRDQNKLNAVLAESPEVAVEKIMSDPIFILYRDWKKIYDEQISGQYNKLNDEIQLLQKRYMRGLVEVFPNKKFWPDANSTMRVAYGKVQGYSPSDAVYYKPVTHFDGVVEKYVPKDYEFDVDENLLDLYRTKNYGPYADETGSVPVCFIGTNHTTGGNSGSPAIDANGNLIGLNFDRAWEGTMSDINYDPSICRNIMVDIRYVLFIVDKYAGATHLVEEMKLVHPKK